MAGRPGRRPKPTSIEPELMDAARMALLQAATQLRIPTNRNQTPGGTKSRPRALHMAALAITLQEALELVAAEEVKRARDHDGATWQDVGDALGTTLQSAHSRFR